MKDYTVAALVNNEELYLRCLGSSPDISKRAYDYRIEGARSASIGYNQAIRDSKTRYVILVHQDVLLPAGWFDQLTTIINRATSEYPNWAVLGAYGISVNGEHKGHVYCTATGNVLGGQIYGFIKAQSLDELCLVIDTHANLLFDEELPGFHLYGTDICQRAELIAKCALIADLYCIHNTNAYGYLPVDFWKAHKHIRKSHRNNLPIITPCTRISSNPLFEYARAVWRWTKSRVRPRNLVTRKANVGELYRQLRSSNKLPAYLR